MKKFTILSLILLFGTSAAFAQRTGAVSGQITDNATAEKIIGAVVEFKSTTDTTFVKHEVSDGESKFSASGLPYGDYTMRITFLGYEPAETKVTVNARNINLSHIFLNQSTTEIEGINVQAQAMRTSMNGDTLIYNAHAFKVSEDADADELLRQLPGVEVGQDGSLKAQGKDIKKIFVDGKETFGTDVASTMKNIPANVIDKVEVYNKLSDFAETTGIHDGDDFQVMNFVTGVSFAQFGTFTALYGYEDKYSFDARYNIVTGNHGIILNANTNNTGSSGSFGGFGGMAGMMGGGGYGGRYGGGRGMSNNNKAIAHIGGINYNYQNAEKLRLGFFYNYGHNDNESKGESDRTYFNTELTDLYNRSTAESKNNSIGNSHRFGSNIQWKITPKQSLNMRLSGNYSVTNSGAWSETDQFTDILENLFQHYESKSKSRNENYSFNGGINYAIKSNKQGRSLSVGLNGGISKSDGRSTQTIHQIMNREPKLDSLGRNQNISDNNSYNLRVRAQYSEPLSKYWSMMAVYDFSYSYSDADRSATRWEYLDNFNDGKYVPWNEGSNIMETRDLSHRVGPGIYYTKNSDVLRLDVVYKYSKQEMDRKLPLPEFKDEVSFNNFVYNAMYIRKLSPQKQLDFRIEADTRNPSVTQLQDVDDISNTLYVTSGNSKLSPYYSHSGSISYNSSHLTKSISFSAGVHGSVTTDYIGTDKKIVTEGSWTTPNGTELKKGAQYSRPVNLNKSAWSFGANASFGKPLNFIKCNFNAMVSASYNETPGLVNGDANTAKTQNVSLYTSLSSNWGTDFTSYLSYNISPGVTNNTHKDYSKATNLNQSISLDVTWKMWLDFVLRADISYTNNLQKQKNIISDYRFENVACNMSLGKKIFRNKRGEITFSINDLFNQNKYSSQSVFTDYIENAIEKGIGRYFSLSFTYRLRDFHKNGQSMNRSGGFDRGGHGGMRSGSRPYLRMGGGSRGVMMRPM